MRLAHVVAFETTAQDNSFLHHGEKCKVSRESMPSHIYAVCSTPVVSDIHTHPAEDKAQVHHCALQTPFRAILDIRNDNANSLCV